MTSNSEREVLREVFKAILEHYETNDADTVGKGYRVACLDALGQASRAHQPALSAPPEYLVDISDGKQHLGIAIVDDKPVLVGDLDVKRAREIVAASRKASLSEPAGDVVERVARAINPTAFDSYERHIEYRMKEGGTREE